MIHPFDYSEAQMRTTLEMACGDRPADLLLAGGRLVNVLSGEIYPADVAIGGDRIAGVSTPPGRYRGREVIDLAGEYVAAGFIDAHVHIESDLLLPAQDANEVL